MSLIRGVLFVACLSPAAAWAGALGPSVTIVSPAANACVNNGGAVFTGGVPGGQAAEPLHDLTFRLQLSEPAGNDIDLSFEVDGQAAYETTFTPAAAGDSETTDIALPAGVIEDGAQRTVRVTATSTAGSASAQVSFRLDRVAPHATFDDASLAQLGSCIPAGPPAVQYQVADEQDAHPQSSERLVTDGCAVRRIIHTQDDCGNAQEIAFLTTEAPQPGAVTISFSGVEENGQVGGGNLTYSIDGPASCAQTVSAEYTVDGGAAQPFVSGQDLGAQPGLYDVGVNVTVCGGAQITAHRHFTVLNQPVADIGGPYMGRQGDVIHLDASHSSAPAQLGGIAEYGWDLNNDGFFDANEGTRSQVDFDTSVTGDGVFPIFLRIRTGNGQVEFAHTTVTVLDVDPHCDAGGPYLAHVGELVQFDGTHSAPGTPSDPIRVWDWDFGDGMFPQRAADLSQPFHAYGAPGHYTVRLRIEDPDSACNGNADVIVSDVDPIIAGIGALDADHLVEGTPVMFSAGSTGPGADSDPITNYVWDFGPMGAHQEGPLLRAPTYTYDDNGQYHVCLTVNDTNSSANQCFDVTVADLAPTANFTGDRLGDEGQELTFDASESFAGGDADPIQTYVWNFGDGTPEVRAEADHPIQTHVFPHQGQFDVQLVVEDEDSPSEPFTQHVVIADVPPTAHAEVHYADDATSGQEGVPLTFDASASTPGVPGDPLVRFAWDFGDGTPPVEGADQQVVQHAFPDQGHFDVQMTVTDQDGVAVSADVEVDIDNVAPTARIAVDSDQLEQGQSVTFRAEVTDVDADPPTVTWDMGDGSAPLQGESVDYSYAALGQYDVTAHVDDGDGGTVDAHVQITVTRAAPRITLPPPVHGREGEPLEFEVRVDAARIDADSIDALAQVQPSNLPPGATSELGDDGDPASSRTLTIHWTPGFTAAGDYNIRVSALAVSGTTRAVDVPVHVDDGGTPLLAAASSTGNRGVVTLYEYGFDSVRQVETFQPQHEIEVGVGVGGMAVTDDGDWLFVAVPGSGSIAVVATRGAHPDVVRHIPVDPLTAGVAWGDGHVWAVSAATDSIIAIDPVRMKVVARAPLAPLQGAVDLTWVPADFGGVHGPARIAVVGQRNGTVALVDPAAVLAGQPAVVASLHIGGRLQRVAASDADAGWLAVADGKTRRLYQISAADIAAGHAQPTSTPLVFAASDLIVVGDTLWAASPGGLVQVGADGHAQVHTDLASTAITPLDPRIRAGGGLVVATDDQIANLAADDLSRQLSAPSGHVRRLAAFIAQE